MTDPTLIVAALLGLDDWPGTDVDNQMAQLYHHNAAFHHSIDALASLLPAMVDGLATASREIGDRMQESIDRMLAAPPQPKLYVVDADDSITPLVANLERSLAEARGEVPPTT